MKLRQVILVRLPFILSSLDSIFQNENKTLH